MTQYFLKSLENEVSNAKRAGTYDVGIRTLTGNNIEVCSFVLSFIAQTSFDPLVLEHDG